MRQVGLQNFNREDGRCSVRCVQFLELAEVEPDESDLGHEMGSDYEVPHHHLQSSHQICPRRRTTAYDSASSSQLQKLDRIQYSALKLCCGATTTTSASALQVECGEAPLRLRRLQQQIKFAVKVKATTSHIAKNVFDDH